MRTVTGLLFCSFAFAASGRAQALPDGPGKDVFAKVCSGCHGLDRIVSQKRAGDAWQRTVTEMRAKGADGTEADFEAIVNYLAKNFGPGDGAPATPAVMPDGPGKQFILSQCTACHKPEHFTQYHHTPPEWQAIVARMGARVPAATKADLDAVEKYFVTNYPKVEAATDPNKVNMNKATAKEMETRLNLTAAEAEAIVHYREEHGDFKEWRDMLIIYGVNGKRVQALQEKMAF